MSAIDWLQLLLLGALVGASGQMARLVVGLKKLNDTAVQNSTTVQQELVPSRIVISLAIGAVAGILGALSLGIKPNSAVEASTLATLIAFGYAGTDFIEGFMSNAKVAKATDSLSPSQPDAPTKKPLAIVPLENAPMIALTAPGEKP
jgi:hypothetical protein